MDKVIRCGHDYQLSVGLSVECRKGYQLAVDRAIQLSKVCRQGCQLAAGRNSSTGHFYEHLLELSRSNGGIFVPTGNDWNLYTVHFYDHLLELSRSNGGSFVPTGRWLELIHSTILRALTGGV